MLGGRCCGTALRRKLCHFRQVRHGEFVLAYGSRPQPRIPAPRSLHSSLEHPLRFSLYGIGLSPDSAGWVLDAGVGDGNYYAFCLLPGEAGFKCSTLAGRACEISCRWVECLGMCDNSGIWEMDMDMEMEMKLLCGGGFTTWKLIWIGPEQLRQLWSDNTFDRPWQMEVNSLCRLVGDRAAKCIANCSDELNSVMPHLTSSNEEIF